MMILSDSDKNKLKTKYGKWAIITGASSGIGKEIATQLAESGVNVILSARRENLLQELATTLENKFKVETKIAVGSLTDDQNVQKLISLSQNLDVGLAVMNAGFGTSGEFIKSNFDKELEMLNLNCKALLHLTHFFSTQFANQKRGGIILVSSMVAFQGVPNAAHYAATKAYVQSLGEGIALELKPLGVDVLVASPGPVETGFAERSNLKMGNAMKAEQIATEILKALGKKSSILPGMLTKILVWSLRTVPRWGKIRIMKIVMGGMTKHQQS